MKAIALLQRLRPGRPRLPVRRAPVWWSPSMPAVVHDFPAGAGERFLDAGYLARHFFPHQVRCLPKPGPDGCRLARWMCGARDPGELWQIVVHAMPPVIDEFPDALFFDAELVWHQQQLNRTGQVASVDLAARGAVLFTMAHQSDLVQRISRRRSYKTRVEKVFAGWHHMLLNGIAAIAAEHGFREIRVPTSRLAMEHTDRARTVRPELFERVYDRAVHHHFRATKTDGWWSIDVEANRAAIVNPERREERCEPGKTVCVCHDIERGLGHLDVDPEFARRADVESPPALDRMLAIEAEAGVRATYNVVGRLLPELRERIERGGHALAFHSYDHDLGREQLGACRQVDYRLKGYRAPQSRLTAELRDAQLGWHNFEWLASSVSSLGFSVPKLENGLVKIPILLDDFDMHRHGRSFADWRRRTIEAIRQHDFVAFSLHDCYAGHWLAGYAELLEEVKTMARLRTMDEVAAELFVAGAV